ncbi:MAG: DUF4026 domain-containing protein [Bacilli bacterium]|nr:DUF4026 domain-containing protein [Bacilli bacterium]
MFKKIKEAPLNYWEEKSYMLVVPANQKDNFLNDSFDRIEKIENLKIKEKDFNTEKGYISIKLEYEDEDYEVGFFPSEISVPEYYLSKNFFFTEEEREVLLKARKSLTIFMKFSDDYKKSYHLQLKLATAMVPDLIGVMDESAEKMLPAKWVFMTANSKVLPNPKSLFTVQAVAGDNKEVWLHTHGLCRCGIPELEILNSDEANYQNHYNLISTYAMYLLDKKNELPNFEVGCFIGRLINGYPVVATSRSWTTGIKEYKHLKLGNLKDRKGGHNTKTNIIFLYKSEEDENKQVLSKVSIYDKLWGENPLFFFSDEETFRMKALAIERFDYVKEAFKNKDNAIIIKVGLPLKEKGKFEHIWFELLEIKGKKFKAKLTQEPYDVPNMHTGDEAWYTVDDITDWIIYTKDFSVNPDNAYLLETFKSESRGE